MYDVIKYFEKAGFTVEEIEVMELWDINKGQDRELEIRLGPLYEEGPTRYLVAAYQVGAKDGVTSDYGSVECPVDCPRDSADCEILAKWLREKIPPGPG